MNQLNSSLATFRSRIAGLSFLFLLMSLFWACSKDTEPENQGNGNGGDNGTVAWTLDLGEAFGSDRLIQVQGMIRNETGPVSGAFVACGLSSNSVVTDENGVFILTGCQAHDRYSFVRVEYDGYFDGFRHFVPPIDGLAQVDITLINRGTPYLLESSQGGTLNGMGWELAFPANAFSLNGSPYTGEVEIEIGYVNPVGQNLFDVIPGGLIGAQSDGIQLLQTFGMLGAELSTPSGQPLELGQPVQVQFALPNDLIAMATPTIDLWSLNETNGLWMKEGEAVLEDGRYHAQVEHFSWWNIDAPSNFVFLDGIVTKEGIAVSNEEVMIEVVETGYSGITWTNPNGYFSGMVPRDQSLALSISACPQGPSPVDVVNMALGVLSNDLSLNIEVESNVGLHSVQGNLIGCDDWPVSQGYVVCNGDYYAANAAGDFEFLTCQDALMLIGFAFDPSQPLLMSDTLLITFIETEENWLLDEVVVCDEVDENEGGLLFDDYGYETAILGGHEWFLENLRSTIYANGDPIPFFQDEEQWAAALSGQQVYYDLDGDNLQGYGRLYNGFAVEDARGLCPTGWHVSTDEDWLDLIDFADAFGSAVEVLKASAIDQPSWNGFNSLEFTALPGGRISSEGDMHLMGNYGYFWATSESTEGAISYRMMSTYSDALDVGDFGANNGYSVRCVSDE